VPQYSWALKAASFAHDLSIPRTSSDTAQSNASTPTCDTAQGIRQQFQHRALQSRLRPLCAFRMAFCRIQSLVKLHPHHAHTHRCQRRHFRLCHGSVGKVLDLVVMTMWAESRISHGLLVIGSWLTDQSAGVALVSIVLVYHMYLSLTDS
jgi:hypothetical protein